LGRYWIFGLALSRTAGTTGIRKVTRRQAIGVHTNQDSGVSIFVIVLLTIARSRARISLPLVPRVDSNLGSR
jgi:hypothetical protein